MVNFKLIKTLHVNNGLGECVIWHHDSGTLFWTDMPGNELLRYHPESDSLVRTPTPENLCSFGFIKNSDWLIGAFQSGLARFHPDTGQLQWLHRLNDYGTTRLNDGRVDRQGRFWVGSLMDNNGDHSPDDGPTGKLFCLHNNGEVSQHLDNIGISNSICWPPNGQYFYFADSPTNQIHRFDFNADRGTLSNRRLFANTAEGVHPDGSVTDAQGYLWNAQWGNGKVVRYGPEGNEDATLQLPVTQATCLTFGGHNLDWLFVTTANFGLSPKALSNQPHAGDLFIYQTNTKGIPEEQFIDNIGVIPDNKLSSLNTPKML